MVAKSWGCRFRNPPEIAKILYEYTIIIDNIRIYHYIFFRVRVGCLAVSIMKSYRSLP